MTTFLWNGHSIDGLFKNQQKVWSHLKKTVLNPKKLQNMIKNKHISLPIFILLALSTSVLAQNRARVFDNFDTSAGVTVVSPVVKPIVAKKSTATKKKAARTSTSKSSYVRKTSYSRAYGSTMSMGTSRSLNGFSTGDPTIDSYIVTSARRYNIDPLLIYAQMHQESAFKRKARSHKGASGLMQLMPATARRFGVTKIYDPKQNIDAGVKYMRWLMNKFNQDVVLALAGYNAGEGAVMKYGNNVPPYRETRNYVKKITKRYRAISNAGYRTANAPSPVRGKVAKKKSSAKDQLSYQADVLAVKLPNGRMRLVTN